MMSVISGHVKNKTRVTSRNTVIEAQLQEETERLNGLLIQIFLSWF